MRDQSKTPLPIPRRLARPAGENGWKRDTAADATGRRRLAEFGLSTFLTRSPCTVLPAVLIATILAGLASGASEVLSRAPTWRGPNVAIPARAQTPLWEDVCEDGGYRIQRHRHLGYYRLLDPGNVRLGWGSRRYCESLLARRPATSDAAAPRFNLVFPTLGGLQFWGDELVSCGWRIQRNAIYGHHRLLDPRDNRRAWGSFEECAAAFEREVDSRTLRPPSDEFVVLLHGLFRARGAFGGLEKHLRGQGYEVVSMKYPSTQGSIQRQAAQLARVVERLEGARTLHFVAHSLGGLIVRCYLRDHRDARIGRVVMIAPPNQGARFASLLDASIVYDLVTGPVGDQLHGGRNSVIDSLPAPWCEFGVIAGGLGNDSGYLPVLGGDNDGVVLVEETRLEGMRDFLVVPAVHTLLTGDERVKRAVVQFLRTGRFAGER